MSKLTVTQIAYEVGVSVNTINRWYKWWENEDIAILNEIVKNGMPTLPAYETIGPSKWRYWNDTDVEQLKAFKEYIPNTKGGFMHSCQNKKKEEK